MHGTMDAGTESNNLVFENNRLTADAKLVQQRAWCYGRHKCLAVVDSSQRLYLTKHRFQENKQAKLINNLRQQEFFDQASSLRALA